MTRVSSTISRRFIRPPISGPRAVAPNGRRQSAGPRGDYWKGWVNCKLRVILRPIRQRDVGVSIGIISICVRRLTNPRWLPEDVTPAAAGQLSATPAQLEAVDRRAPPAN